MTAMKTPLTIFVVLALTGAADAAEMPGEYVGRWCPIEGNSKQSQRCRRGAEPHFIVDARGYSYPDGVCTVTGVIPKGNGHRLIFRCRDDGGAGKPVRFEERWRWNNGRRLIIGAYKP
jgi:hypothetical protein